MNTSPTKILVAMLTNSVGNAPEEKQIGCYPVENRKWGQRILKATVSVGAKTQSEKSTAQPHIELCSTPLHFSVILIVSFCIDCLICTQKITIHTWNTDILLATVTFQPKYRSLLIYIVIYIIKHYVSLARTFEMPEVTHICSRYLSL